MQVNINRGYQQSKIAPIGHAKDQLFLLLGRPALIDPSSSGKKFRKYRSVHLSMKCTYTPLCAPRMRKSMKRHQKELRDTRATPRIRWYMEQVTHAEELLADFLPHKHKSRKP